MVRHLEEDLRSIGIPGFPERRIVPIELHKDIGLDALPDDTPELVLAGLLEQYRAIRLERMAGMKRRVRNQFGLPRVDTKPQPTLPTLTTAILEHPT